LRYLIVAACAVSTIGCAADSPAPGEWAGAMSDSAGVVIVDNPESGLWTADTQWRLEEDLRIGVTDGDAVRQFDAIDDIAIDGSGRIHVLDGSEVRVFERDGEFVRTYGRPGSGPGELANPSALLPGAADTMFLPDGRNQRVQRFLSDGSDAGAFPIVTNEAISLGWQIRPDGAVLQEVRTLPLTGAGDERVLLLVRGGAGEVLDTVLAMPVGDAMAIRDGQPEMTLFAPEPMWTILTDGRIASGRNSEYRLEVRTADGRLERVVKRPFERRPFSPSDQGEFRAMLRESLEGGAPSPATDRMLRSMNYADHYPVFAALFSGPDGTIWVQHAKDVSSITVADLEAFDVRAVGASSYDVFDAEGRYLGVIVTPDGFEPLHSEGEHIYGIGRDDLGVQHVVRLRAVADTVR
jgi:hypothetical protein